jgi:hypothetical protein
MNKLKGVFFNYIYRSPVKASLKYSKSIILSLFDWLAGVIDAGVALDSVIYYSAVVGTKIF